MTPDTATLARAVVEAVRSNPAIIDEISRLGIPADLLREMAAHPQLSTEEQPAQVPSFSDQAFAIYARSIDGSTFFAIVDPEPPEAA